MQGHAGSGGLVESTERDAEPVVLFLVNGIKKQGGAAFGTESTPDFFGRMVPLQMFNAVNGKGRSLYFRAGEKMAGPLPALHAVTTFTHPEFAINFEGDSTAKT